MVRKLKAGADPVKTADEYADIIVQKCRKIGEYGGALIKDGMKLMTHCNAGALATVDIGTALAPMRNAHDAGHGRSPASERDGLPDLARGDPSGVPRRVREVRDSKTGGLAR